MITLFGSAHLDTEEALAKDFQHAEKIMRHISKYDDKIDNLELLNMEMAMDDEKRNLERKKFLRKYAKAFRRIN